MIPLVLTYVGDDRPGLVNAVSEKIAAFGGTLAREPLGPARRQVRRHRARQRARGRMSRRSSAPCATLRRRDSYLTIERGAHDEAAPTARLITLDILGNERPGIVRDVTQALNALGVNIEEFESGLESAAFTGVEMFRAHARLRALRKPCRSTTCARRSSGSPARSWST